MNATINFAQMVKKATCLIRTTQHNSNNCLVPEFKWTSFEKRSYLDELINISIKAEERSVIQISFWDQDPNIKTGKIRNPRQKLQLIHDPLCFPQNPRIRLIFRTNPQSVRFLRPNQIRKPIHPPPCYSPFHKKAQNTEKMNEKVFYSYRLGYCGISLEIYK